MRLIGVIWVRVKMDGDEKGMVEVGRGEISRSEMVGGEMM